MPRHFDIRRCIAMMTPRHAIVTPCFFHALIFSPYVTPFAAAELMPRRRCRYYAALAYADAAADAASREPCLIS